ncbi:hypothetical protein DITRI_Ditri02bG0130700 [Diplodiscus trichospermus]
MKILAWNYQGLGSTFTVHTFRGLRKKQDPDMVVLMETKNKRGRVEKVRKSVGYKEGYYVEPKGLSRGLALWWKKGITVNVLESNRNIIDVRVFCSARKEERITFVYMAPKYEERVVLCEKMRKNGERVRERRQQNKIMHIKKENGESIDNEEMIMEEFMKYYQKLFKTEDNRNWGNILEYISRVVSKENNERLTREVFDTEIKEVVF